MARGKAAKGTSSKKSASASSEAKQSDANVIVIDSSDEEDVQSSNKPPLVLVMNGALDELSEMVDLSDEVQPDWPKCLLEMQEKEQVELLPLIELLKCCWLKGTSGLLKDNALRGTLKLKNDPRKRKKKKTEEEEEEFFRAEIFALVMAVTISDKYYGKSQMIKDFTQEKATNLNDHAKGKTTNLNVRDAHLGVFKALESARNVFSNANCATVRSMHETLQGMRKPDLKCIDVHEFLKKSENTNKTELVSCSTADTAESDSAKNVSYNCIAIFPSPSDTKLIREILRIKKLQEEQDEESDVEEDPKDEDEDEAVRLCDIPFTVELGGRNAEGSSDVEYKGILKLHLAAKYSKNADSLKLILEGPRSKGEIFADSEMSSFNKNDPKPISKEDLSSLSKTARDSLVQDLKFLIEGSKDDVLKNMTIKVTKPDQSGESIPAVEITLPSEYAQSEQDNEIPEREEGSQGLAHPEQREVAEELFEKACEVLTGSKSPSKLATMFDRVYFVILVPNFNSLLQQTKERVEAAMLTDGHVMKYTMEPKPAVNEQLKQLQALAEKERNLILIVADECHHGPGVSGAHHQLLNEKLNGKNILRLLVSATPQNALTSCTRIPKKNIVTWYKATSLYRSMDYYVETATWAIPAKVSNLRFKVYDNAEALLGSGEIPVHGHDNRTFRFPMHDYGSYVRVLNSLADETLAKSDKFEHLPRRSKNSGAMTFSVEIVGSGETKVKVRYPFRLLEFDESNFYPNTGILNRLGFSQGDFPKIGEATEHGNKKFIDVTASKMPNLCDMDGEKGKKESGLVDVAASGTPNLCAMDGEKGKKEGGLVDVTASGTPNLCDMDGEKGKKEGGLVDVTASGTPNLCDMDGEKGKKEGGLVDVTASGTPNPCDMDGKKGGLLDVDCLPRRRQKVLCDNAFQTFLSICETNANFGKRLSKERKATKFIAKNVPLYNGHILMTDYILSLTFLAIYRVDRERLFDTEAMETAEDIFLPIDDYLTCVRDESKLKEFAQMLGFAEILGFDQPNEKVTEFKAATGMANVQHVMDVLLNALCHTAWGELIGFRAAGGSEDDDSSEIDDSIEADNDETDEVLDLNTSDFKKTLSSDEIEILEKMRKKRKFSSKKVEFKTEDIRPDARRILWKYIIWSKLKRHKEDLSHEQDNTSEAWYNETDRLVYDLLNIDPKYRTGRMAVIRVYESDENLSVQDGLRSALKRLKLTSDDINKGGVLSVVADIGGHESKQKSGRGRTRTGTSLHKQVEAWTLERDLRHPFEQAASSSPREGIRERVKKHQGAASEQNLTSRKTRSGRAPKQKEAAAKYEDLENLPTIVILCEKGRMGDTFPHSLRFLDLRLRSSKTYSTFVQEFGRVCRYPALRKDEDGFRDIEVRVNDNGVIENENDAKIEEIGIWLQRFFIDCGSVAVSDPGNNVCFHADSQRQLEDRFSQELRQRESSGNRPLRGTWKVRMYVHMLPTVLMSPERFKTQIAQAIENKYEHCWGGNRIDQCIPGDVDKYVQRKGQLQGFKCEYIEGELSVTNPLHSIKSYRKTLIPKATARDPHYDDGRTPGEEKDPKRLLLMAQCQQGKTGTYLHFVRLIKNAIKFEEPVVPEALPLARSQQCIFPYWENLTVSIQSSLRNFYNHPAKGQYHRKAMQQRTLMLLVSSSQKSTNWLDTYLKYLREESGEAIQTKIGIKKVEALEAACRNEACPVKLDPPSVLDSTTLQKCINYDGRFTKDPAVKSAFESWTSDSENEDFVDFANESIAKMNMKEDCLDPIKILRKAQAHVQASLWDCATSAKMDRAGAPRHKQSSSADTNSQPVEKVSKESYTEFAARPVTNDFNQAYNKGSSLDENVSVSGDVLPNIPALSIPIDGFHRISTDDRSSFSPIRVSHDNSLHLQNGAQTYRWVFVPSYNRAGTALLDYRSALPEADGLKTVVCLVVRSGEQFDNYRDIFGSAYVIFGMPTEMPSKYQPRDTVSAKGGGIGYARLFIQLLSSALGLKWVWLLDDNVNLCFQQRIVEDRSNKDERQEGMQACSFDTIMNKIEKIVLDDHKAEPKPKGEYKQMKNPELLLRLEPTPRASATKQAQNRDDLTGGANKYGLIGIRRDPYGSLCEPLKPFQVTYSVYSFVFLNVEETVRREIFYPCKTFWEDVEFNHLLDEEGLVCLKVNHLYHCKTNLKRRCLLEDDSIAKEIEDWYLSVDFDEFSFLRNYELSILEIMSNRFPLAYNASTELWANALKQRLLEFTPDGEARREVLKLCMLEYSTSPDNSWVNELSLHLPSEMPTKDSSWLLGLLVRKGDAEYISDNLIKTVAVGIKLKYRDPGSFCLEKIWENRDFFLFTIKKRHSDDMDIEERCSQSENLPGKGSTNSGGSPQKEIQGQERKRVASEALVYDLTQDESENKKLKSTS